MLYRRRMRKLVLCEKPSVARDLARALCITPRGDGAFVGNDLIITWCIGHLIELEEPAAYAPAWRRWSWDGLPMLPDRFRLRPIAQTAAQWKVVRDLLRRRDFSAVINACDAGREGELIFRFCYELSGCTLPALRLWISSLTPQAIAQGFAALRPASAYDALAAAARCRAESDWLVGLNATRAVTLWRGGKTLLSLGRVQTPTLALLVNREHSILQFVPRDYFELQAHLDASAASDASALAADSSSAQFVARFEYEGKRRFAAAPLADAVALRDRAAAAPWVESVEDKPVREPPPLLFDLGALQRTGNRRFGFSAQQTLSLAQSLYERHKLITYPRTDSRYLSQDLISLLGKTFSALSQNGEYAPFCASLQAQKIGAPRRIFADHKVTDHHAIIPTPVEHTPERLAALSASERQLLDLVVRRFLGAFFPDAEFRETRAVVRVDAESPPAKSASKNTAPAPDLEYLTDSPLPPDRYLARGRVRVRAGWQEVAGFTEASRERAPQDKDGEETEDDEKTQQLPPLSVGMQLRGEFCVVAKKTRPPPRYTEATLLAAMEGAGKQLSNEALRLAMKDHGLGTPATRAAIIETLLGRGYIERQAKRLIPTALGLDLIDSLPVPGLCSAELTGTWEARLSQLSRGEGLAAAFMSDIAAYVRELVSAVRRAPFRPALVAAPRAVATANADAAKAAKKPSRRRSEAKSKPSAEMDAPKKAPRRRTASPKSAEPRRQTAAKPRKATARKKRASAAPVAQDRNAAFSPPVPVPASPPSALPHRLGTPVDPPIICPRCRNAHLIWGRRAWGCANFRSCSFVVPYEHDSRFRSEAELRAACARI